MREDFHEIEAVEFVHQVLAIGEVQFICELGFEVGAEVDVFEGFIGRGDGVVDQRDDLVELFVLLFFYSEWRMGYLNSGIFECLAVVVIFLA